MEQEQYDLLIAILKEAAKHFMAAQLEKLKESGRRAWAVIKEAALAALEWVKNACKSPGSYLGEFWQSVKRALEQVLVLVKAKLAGSKPVTA